MKKEKGKKILTEEEAKKKFRKYMICLEVIECLLIIMGILTILAIGIEVFNGGNYETIQNELFNNNEIRDLVVESIDGEMDSVSNSIINLLNVFIIISSIIVYVVSVFAIEYLRKMFTEMSKTGRVFSESIIKDMKKASVAIEIFAIFKMPIVAALIMILFITTIVYVFEKGYKLQIESDETL